MDGMTPHLPIDSLAMPQMKRKGENLEVTEIVSKKVGIRVYLPADLAERIKNAVYWTPGLTLGGLAQDALRKAVMQLERDRNKGQPFIPRKGELKRGRPLK
jgi:hypothetical protein